MHDTILSLNCVVHYNVLIFFQRLFSKLAHSFIAIELLAFFINAKIPFLLLKRALSIWDLKKSVRKQDWFFSCFGISLSCFCSIWSGPYLNEKFKMPRTKSKRPLITFQRCVTERTMSTMYETIHVWGKLAFFDQSYVAWWQW